LRGLPPQELLEVRRDGELLEVSTGDGDEYYVQSPVRIRGGAAEVGQGLLRGGRPLSEVFVPVISFVREGPHHEDGGDGVAGSAGHFSSLCSCPCEMVG